MDEGRGVVVGGGRELLDLRAGRERIHERPHRRIRRPAGLVGQRDSDLAAGRERAQRPHLRPGHVLEPVGEHRPRVPRAEAPFQERGRDGAAAGPVVHADAVDGGAVGRDERRELLGTGRVGGGARLGHRGRELVGERADGFPEAGEPRRRGQRVQRCVADDVCEQEAALDIADERTGLAAAAEHLFEQIVERAHAAADEHAAAPHQVTLDRLDVGAVGHDQERVGVGVRRLQEPVEQEGDLAAVGRAEDELERHQVILCVGSRAPSSYGGLSLRRYAQIAQEL